MYRKVSKKKSNSKKYSKNLKSKFNSKKRNSRKLNSKKRNTKRNFKYKNTYKGGGRGRGRNKRKQTTGFAENPQVSKPLTSSQFNHRLNSLSTGETPLGFPNHTTSSASSLNLGKWTTNQNSNHYHSISSQGSGSAFDNRPSYYVLAFIMKLRQSN